MPSLLVLVEKYGCCWLSLSINWLWCTKTTPADLDKQSHPSSSVSRPASSQLAATSSRPTVIFETIAARIILRFLMHQFCKWSFSCDQHHLTATMFPKHLLNLSNLTSKLKTSSWQEVGGFDKIRIFNKIDSLVAKSLEFLTEVARPISRYE